MPAAPPAIEPTLEPGLKDAAVAQTVLVKEPAKIKSTPRTPQLTSLLKADPKNDAATSNVTNEAALAEPYTEVQLREAWNAYADQRKKFQAEYQMLSQPYRLEDHLITVELLSPVHETMLNNIKSELTAFLRDQLRNNFIQVTGQLHTGEEKKIIYTNREKFDFLVEKNPMLRELKDRLGLDTDF
jgi:hypothetical protein